jgi:hypothetical protein
MYRGYAAFRGALLSMIIASGIVLAAGSVASATTVSPLGAFSVTPQKFDEGSTGNNLTFSYLPGSQLSDGKVSLKVPKNWTLPQKLASGAPGFVEASTGRIVTSKRVITVRSLNLCKSCALILTYTDATAPTTVGSSTFVARTAKAGQPLKKLSPAPTVMVKSSTGATTTTTTSSTTTTTSTTLPCAGQPATASSDGVTMTVTPGTCLIGGAVVALSGSGFDPGSLGVVLECNDDASQPTVTMSVVGSAETLPVSCSGLSLSHIVTITSSGDFPPGATFTVIAGTPGPPCGAGDLVVTCPADSSGGNTTADAAQYPCPPTPAQQDQGVTCSLGFSDNAGKQQTVDLSFGLPG